MRYSNSYGNSHNLSHHILFSGFSRTLDSFLLFFFFLCLLFSFLFPFAFVAVLQFDSLSSFFFFTFMNSIAFFYSTSSIRCFHRQQRCRIYMNSSIVSIWWLPNTIRLSVNVGAATNNSSSPSSKKKWRKNRMDSRVWSFGGKQKARAQAL